MSREVDQRRLADLARLHAGPFTGDEVRRRGVPQGTVRRSLSTGDLIKLGRSAFCPRDLWERADSWQKFRLRSLGFAISAAPGDHLTGWSSAVLLGFPTWGEPPEVVTAIRDHPTLSGTNQSMFAHIRTGTLPTPHRLDRGRYRLTDPAFTAIDLARHGSPELALISLDHVAHAGVHPDELRCLLEQLRNYPGIERAVWAVDQCDPRAESVLETLGRLAFIEVGREPPLSNVWISTPEGDFRADHLLPGSGTVIEGDGGQKLRDAESPHAAMRQQVVRESAIRAQGFALERYDLPIATHSRSRIVALADRAVRSQRGRPIPRNWTLDPPEHLRKWFANQQLRDRQSRAAREPRPTL